MSPARGRLRALIENCGLALGEAELERLAPVYETLRGTLDRRLHGLQWEGAEAWFILPPEDLRTGTTIPAANVPAHE